MTNPLYDRLLKKHAGKTTPFLHLGNGGTVTYEQFLGLTARLAHVLTERGLRPGDRMAVQVQKSPEALALITGCIQAGIVFLPLNTGYTIDELSYFIENSEAGTVICDEASREGLAPIAARLGAGLETLNADGSGTLDGAGPRSCPSSFSTVERSLVKIWPPSFIHPAQPVAPKGAMLTHEQPPVKRAYPGRQLGGSPADDVLVARVADFSHAWSVCRHQCGAGGRGVA